MADVTDSPPIADLIERMDTKTALVYLCRRADDTRRCVKEVHSVVVGTADRPGLAEIVRGHERRLDDVEKKPSRSRKRTAALLAVAAGIGAGIAKSVASVWGDR